MVMSYTLPPLWSGMTKNNGQHSFPYIDVTWANEANKKLGILHIFTWHYARNLCWAKTDVLTYNQTCQKACYLITMTSLCSQRGEGVKKGQKNCGHI